MKTFNIFLSKLQIWKNGKIIIFMKDLWFYLRRNFIDQYKFETKKEKKIDLPTLGKF